MNKKTKHNHAKLIDKSITYTRHSLRLFAEKIKVNYFTVYSWKVRNKVPVKHQGKFGRVTGGNVTKADFT